MNATIRRAVAPAATAFYRTVWKLTRGMTLGVRGLARDGEGRVLLVRHTYRDGWYLPGGGVEAGEAAEEALVREMAEEGGVAAAARPVLFGFYCNHRAHRNDHVAFYVIPAWTPCPPDSADEIAERGFFSLDALPEGATPATRRRLAEIAAGAPADAYW